VGVFLTFSLGSFSGFTLMPSRNNTVRPPTRNSDAPPTHGVRSRDAPEERMAEEAKAEARKHHFVPQFYLRGLPGGGSVARARYAARTARGRRGIGASVPTTAATTRTWPT